MCECVCVCVCMWKREERECSWIWVSSECDHLKHVSDPYIPSLYQTHSDAKGGGRSSVSRSRNVVPAVDENPHIGNYRLLKTIGKGNFAKVKLARHVLTSKEVTRLPVYLPFLLDLVSWVHWKKIGVGLTLLYIETIFILKLLVNLIYNYRVMANNKLNTFTI